MARTRTESLIDTIGMWSALVIYLAVWWSLLSWGFAPGLLLPALGVSVLYVGMHAFELAVYNRCYMSADSTALPVTAVVTAIAALVVHFTNDASWWALLMFLLRGAAALFLGHVFALLYAGFFDRVIARCFRQRIAVERSQLKPDDEGLVTNPKVE